jgi:hypothetical protein
MGKGNIGDHRMRKIAVDDITDEHLGEYNFYASYEDRWGKIKFLGSNSIHSLKREIKDRGISSAWITNDKDYWTVRGRFVYEWHYVPRYYQHRRGLLCTRR